ncbi:MAG: CYTH domain-containing protein [Bacteroidales bacterium]|nr:CYTH domain-containing protein [Bacteroidales bacterium]
MGLEIERKFLVQKASFLSSIYGKNVIQGFILSKKEKSVRVRNAGGRATLTVKGETLGSVRQEFEYSIPVEDARELLALCEGPLIEKCRYEIPWGPLVWDVDVFYGDNEGLIVAEIEIPEVDYYLDLPEWIGEEVTSDPRYYNSNLIQHPYSEWKK